MTFILTIFVFIICLIVIRCIPAITIILLTVVFLHGLWDFSKNIVLCEDSKQIVHKSIEIKSYKPKIKNIKPIEIQPVVLDQSKENKIESAPIENWREIEKKYQEQRNIEAARYMKEYGDPVARIKIAKEILEFERYKNKEQIKKSDSEKIYWITNGSGKRHKMTCRWWGVSNGRRGSKEDGIACLICGG